MEPAPEAALDDVHWRVSGQHTVHTQQQPKHHTQLLTHPSALQHTHKRAHPHTHAYTHTYTCTHIIKPHNCSCDIFYRFDCDVERMLEVRGERFEFAVASDLYVLDDFLICNDVLVQCLQ